MIPYFTVNFFIIYYFIVQIHIITTCNDRRIIMQSSIYNLNRVNKYT